MTLSSVDNVSIALTDSGTPTLTITATQTTNDGNALAEIVTPFTITVADTAANLTANVSPLEQLASTGELASVIVIAGGPEIITTVLLEALLNGGNIVYLGNGAPTFHRPDAVLDNTGDTINLGTSAFQNFYLNGGVIQDGTLITGPGGIINSPGGSDGFFANDLLDVTVLGGLTLDPGNSLELDLGTTVNGDLTVDSSAYLFLSRNLTFENLTLNGGNVDVGEIAGTTTIAPNGLMEGYGDIVGSPAQLFSGGLM
jgi:hypothetical protein